jgi:4'-phosphopantetheinyl transferase
MSLIPLTSTDLHVWLLPENDPAIPAALESTRSWLAPDEHARAARYRHEGARQHYLLTRALVRNVLSRYADVDPSNWQFSANAYGRPEIANSLASLQFNVAHTKGLIVMAVTREAAIGIDVENIVEREAATNIADSFFAPTEAAALQKLDTRDQQLRFFEYWTLKESYIKARGMGLSLPLDKFSFEFPDERSVRLSVDAQLQDDSGRWHFLQARPTDEHLMAICRERSDRALDPVVRRVVPGFGERIVATEWPRRTD